MRDKSKIRRIVNLETRKSVHINLTRATHQEFRKKLIDYNLSMQEVFEYFASLVAEDDNKAVAIVENAFDRKRNREIKRVTEKEAENLYDAISYEDPFEKK